MAKIEFSVLARECLAGVTGWDDLPLSRKIYFNLSLSSSCGSEPLWMNYGFAVQFMRRCLTGWLILASGDPFTVQGTISWQF